MKKLFIFMLLTASFAQAAGLNKGLDQNQSINKAHESYLEGDFRQTLMNIKTGLEQFDRDPIIKKNLLSLYANLLHSGKLKDLDLGWSLPEEISNLRLNIHRETDEEVLYFLNFSGHIPESNSIKNLKITRFPDLVIFDKENKVGRFREYQDLNNAKLSFTARSQKTTLKVQPGLYNVDISTTKGNSAKIWFIIDDSMNASVSPEFKQFPKNKVFTNGLPHFSWSDLTTPEFHPKEGRELYFEISKNSGSSNWESLWNIWENSPKTMKVELGKTKPEVTAQLPLENGSYMALIQFMETTRLGSIKMSRRTTQIRDFKIETKK